MSLAPPLVGVASAYPLPNTTPTPAAGEQVKASDVQLAAQGLLNQDMALQAQVNLKAPIASPTFTGVVTISGADPNPSAAPPVGQIFPAGQAKAWAFASTTNTTTMTLNGNINVASVTTSLSTIGIVAFARPMADANYAAKVTSEMKDAYGVVVNGSKTINGFHFNLWKTSDFTSLWALDATGHDIDIDVFGRQ